MNRNPRIRALALKIALAAYMMAITGLVSAVPLEFSAAGSEITLDGVIFASQQQLPAAETFMIAGSPASAASVSRTLVVEPGTLALLGLGLVIIGFTTSVRPRRRRDRSSKKRESL